MRQLILSCGGVWLTERNLCPRLRKTFIHFLCIQDLEDVRDLSDSELLRVAEKQIRVQVDWLRHREWVSYAMLQQGRRRNIPKHVYYNIGKIVSSFCAAGRCPPVFTGYGHSAPLCDCASPRAS